MTNAERSRRIKQSIAETLHLLDKANTKHTNSLICLGMEIEENKELGNDDSANSHAKEYVNGCAARCEELKNHLDKLNNMFASC